MAFFRNVYRTYIRWMEKHPYKMQAIQTGFLMGAGDILAQSQIEKKDANIDFKRTAVYCCVGTFFIAPIVARWYVQLEHIYGTDVTLATTLKKVATDQFIFAPLVIPFVVTLISLGEGKTVEDVKEKLKKEYFNLLKANYAVWPLFQVVNFYFIPLNYRIITLQLVAILWNAYLSFKIK